MKSACSHEIQICLGHYWNDWILHSKMCRMWLHLTSDLCLSTDSCLKGKYITHFNKCLKCMGSLISVDWCFVCRDINLVLEHRYIRLSSNISRFHTHVFMFPVFCRGNAPSGSSLGSAWCLFWGPFFGCSWLVQETWARWLGTVTSLTSPVL